MLLNREITTMNITIAVGSEIMFVVYNDCARVQLEIFALLCFAVLVCLLCFNLALQCYISSGGLTCRM